MESIPRKINMEPTNHQFRKETHLPKPSFLVLCQSRGLVDWLSERGDQWFRNWLAWFFRPESWKSHFPKAALQDVTPPKWKTWEPLKKWFPSSESPENQGLIFRFHVKLWGGSLTTFCYDLTIWRVNLLAVYFPQGPSVRFSEFQVLGCPWTGS